MRVASGLRDGKGALAALVVVVLAGVILAAGSAPARAQLPSRTVTICKYVVDNGNGVTDSGSFSGEITDPNGRFDNVPWSVNATEGGPIVCDTETASPATDVVVTENVTAAGGYPKYVIGSFSDGAAACANGLALGPGVLLEPGQDDVLVCNQAPRTTLTVRKIILGGTAGTAATFTGGYSGPSSGSWSVPVAQGASEGTSVAYDVAPGSYTITETPPPGYALDHVGACPPTDGGEEEGRDQVNGDVEVPFGGQAEVCVYNVKVGTLVIRKVEDLDGDGSQGPGERLLRWTVRVTGPSFPGGSDKVLADGSASLSLLEGSYTVTEASEAGYAPVGPQTQTVAVAQGATATVTFYNRPLVSVQVRKRLIDRAVESAGPGFTFRLTGCGITPREGTTDGSGLLTFAGLPSAGGCTYTVTEAFSASWVPDKGSQDAYPTQAGSTAVLTFINRPFSLTGVTPAATPVSTPTATATATPTPTTTATATPTATAPTTATASPTAVATTATASTTAGAGVGATAVTTPKPPATGNGPGLADGRGAWLAAMLAAAAVGTVAGLSLVVTGRRRR